jgi:hypothetical protein
MAKTTIENGELLVTKITTAALVRNPPRLSISRDGSPRRPAIAIRCGLYLKCVEMDSFGLGLRLQATSMRDRATRSATRMLATEHAAGRRLKSEGRIARLLGRSDSQ